MHRPVIKHHQPYHGNEAKKLPTGFLKLCQLIIYWDFCKCDFVKFLTWCAVLSLLSAVCVLVDVSCSRVAIDLDLRGWIKMRWNKDGELSRSEEIATSDPQSHFNNLLLRAASGEHSRTSLWLSFIPTCANYDFFNVQIEPASQQQMKPRYMCCIVDVYKAYTDHRMLLWRSIIPSWTLSRCPLPVTTPSYTHPTLHTQVHTHTNTQLHTTTHRRQMCQTHFHWLWLASREPSP